MKIAVIVAFRLPAVVYPIEGVSVVTLDKDLQWVQRRVRQGDNVELACDVSGSPPPPVVWERNGVYLGVSKVCSTLIDRKLDVGWLKPELSV